MFVEVIVAAISLINLIIVSVLMYSVIKRLEAFKYGAENTDGRAERYYHDLLERIRRIEEDYPAQALAIVEEPVLDTAGAGTNRIKSAVKKIREGDTPEDVRREFGYSRSEIGIILASAGLSTELDGKQSL